MLAEIAWRDMRDGPVTRFRSGSLFVMIGAVPNGLGGHLPLDDAGFVVTGQGTAGGAALSPYETSTAGIFAVGDVRSGSIKRVASGFGEGSVVVQAIHRFRDGLPH